MAAPINLTPELLHAAYVRRRRADWPLSFEACMADAVCAALVKLEAFCHARRQQASLSYQQRRQARRANTPPIAGGAQRLSAPTLPAKLDAKRLAAGERDDD